MRIRWGMATVHRLVFMAVVSIWLRGVSGPAQAIIILPNTQIGENFVEPCTDPPGDPGFCDGAAGIDTISLQNNTLASSNLYIVGFLVGNSQAVNATTSLPGWSTRLVGNNSG